GYSHCGPQHVDLWVVGHRNPPPVVTDRTGAIDVTSNLDQITVAGKMLVDGVVQNLENTVMQAALVGLANVHSGALTNRRQTLEFIDFGSVVFLGSIRQRDRSFVVHYFRFFGHKMSGRQAQKEASSFN